MNAIIARLAGLNWRLFVIGFAAGFIGIILTRGGIHIPKQFTPFTSVNTAGVMQIEK